MIVGFAGSHIGLLYPQTLALRPLFGRLKMDAYVHRARGNIDTLAHNMVRGQHPRLPIHVLAILDEHSVIASVRNDDPLTFIWARRERDDVNRVIANSVSGIIFVPKTEKEELADGWDLVIVAREIGVPVLIVWTDGRLELERNDEL